jgi:hypothetical protein
MTTPMKSFTTAAKADELPEVSFAVEGDWGREEFTATRPSDGVMMMFVAYTSEQADERTQLYELLKLFEKALGEDFPRFRDLVEQDRLDPVSVVEIFQWLMEEWSAFPTQPSSGSRPLPAGTGGRSTGRSPGKGSTRRVSP